MLSIENIRTILHDNCNKWLVGTHQGNDGNQGNTLEGLLGVEENNLQLPDLGEIELKTQKIETGSYVTLFHKEPKPRASIPKLLKSMGWRHQSAGDAYRHDEKSFRSTTPAHRYTDRGFTIELTKDRIELIFDATKVNSTASDITGSYNNYGDWLRDIESREPHYSTVLPVYWDRREFEAICFSKLNNTLMCYCETRKIDKIEHFLIKEAYIYKNFMKDKLESLFAKGGVVIDFDARTRHNHGTKLRVAKDKLKDLFAYSEQIL